MSLSRLIFGIFMLFVPFSIHSAPLGLPEVPVPKNNPQSKAKIALGEKLFNDTRFSSTGKVSCATCHEKNKAFTDSPKPVSEGINNLKGTRNAPTVVNAAYMSSLFWDGREPDLEGQSAQPFLNPVEMALKDHTPILNIVRSDNDYKKMFKAAFGQSGKATTMKQVKQAIASFERTLVSGDSAFDRYYFGSDKTALSEEAIQGFEVFLNEGRCVSCHSIDQNHALFTDNRFHNLNVGFARIDKDVKEMATAFSRSKRQGTNVDIAVLSNQNISELGRFAVTDKWTDMGGFKTPTLRNIEVTAPYMHDGSLETLEDVVEFYVKGGRVNDNDPINAFQSGGIRPLDLNDEQKENLVAFLKALTSPEFAN